ncbi:MAG: hypothetical protein PUP90_25995 [Nostoc sp. S4]|nr:hypothetical protein [Nostoc sp. S4]
MLKGRAIVSKTISAGSIPAVLPQLFQLARGVSATLTGKVSVQFRSDPLNNL